MEPKENDAWILEALAVDRAWAEHVLLHYDELLKDYEKRKAVALIVMQSNVSGGHGSLPGKPTENTAIRSADYDERSNDYQWLRAVRIVEESLSERKKIFLEVRRRAEKQAQKVNGKVSWVSWTYTEYENIMVKRYKKVSNRSERTMRAWWQELVEEVRLVYLKRKSQKNKNF